jgi:hypothetical protein
MVSFGIIPCRERNAGAHTWSFRHEGARGHFFFRHYLWSGLLEKGLLLSWLRVHSKRLIAYE